MRNKNILKVLSLLAAACIAAGCNGSTAADMTTTTTSAQITTTVTTVAEITTSAEGTDSEFLGLAEAEIDYVDEYGRKRYKNPTIWTTEKIFEELTINGQKFEAPLTLEKIGEGYSYSLDGAFYDEETRTACLRLMYNDKSLAWVYLDDCNSMDDIEGKTYSKIQFDFSATTEELFENVAISGCGLNSTQNDIVNCLGTPCVATESYVIYTEMEFSSVDSYDLPGETITFYVNDDKVMLFSITLK